MERIAVPEAVDENLLVPAPSAQDVHDQLGRILSSRTFRSARGQKKFLQYTVDEALEGRSSQLKEYSLGLEVFGRGESFDPRLNNIVRVEASKLRSKLAKYYDGEGQQDPVRIDFPKGSYIPACHWRVSPAAQDIPETSNDRPSRRDLKEAWWPLAKRNIAVVIGVALLLASATWVLFRGDATIRSPDPSIAVLPFVNLNDDQNDFLSDGLTEDLIGSLARIPGMHVVARTSAFEYKGKTVDVRKIGRELNVRNVLEGTVRQSGDRLRITAQLSDTHNGYQLWSASYDRKVKDALSVQREISDSIAGAMGVQFAKGVSSDSLLVSRQTTVSPPAFEAYLKGRFFWNKNSPGSVKTAIRYFEQAISIDPNFPLPYTGLAHAYTAMLVITNTPSAELIPKIRMAASRALELDSSLGEAHLDLAETFLVDFDWPGAERELKKALELSPGDALSHRYYAFYLTKMGRVLEAGIESKKALNLDPISPFMASGYADSLFNQHRFDEAIGQYRKAVELDPSFGMGHRGLGRAYIQSGRFAEGIVELLAAQRLMDGDPISAGQLGYAYAVSGSAVKARDVLKVLLEQSKRGQSPAGAISKIYIALGDKDLAFYWLEKSVNQRELGLDLKADPLYDSLRTDPRFEELLRRMSLL